MQPSYKGTFEAHITVSAGNSALRQKFKLICQNLNIKCVFIELPEGATRSQPMTASYHHGALKDVLQQINQIVQKIVNADLEITRIKIEAMVSNQDIPISDIEAQKLPKSNYFEFHVKAILSADENLEVLRKYCLQHKAHLSANAFKKLVDGKQQRFITMRAYAVGYQSAQKRFDNLLLHLKSKGYKLSQQQREYTVYDSNLNLDAGWIN
ncbi:MAG: hypothetical protein AAF630_01370 [Cyanobacteria bacterium P01_C01_bin.38]